MSQDVFANCTQHYRIERYFQNCTNTTRQCDLIGDLQTITTLLLIFDYYISTILFCLAFAVNVYFLSLCLPIFLQMDNETKKRYVFAVSRCISSIAASATLLILRCVFYVYFPSETSSYYLYAVVIVAGDISFYSLQGSYIGMALLLYIGVLHPTYFSTRLTLCQVYSFAVFNLVLATLISVPCGLLQAATFFDSGPISCDSQVCRPTVNLINYIIGSAAFILTILILAFVLICLSWHIQRSKKVGSYTSSQTLYHARIRLSWTLFAITFIALAEGIPSSFQLRVKSDSVLRTCNNFYQADRLFLVTICSSLDSLLWAVVLLIDPLASIILDKNVSSQVVRQINRAKVIYAKLLSCLLKPT